MSAMRAAILALVLASASMSFASKVRGRELIMPGESYWFAVANQTFDVAGNVVHWSGVNWNGFDSMNCVVDGLWGSRTIGSHLDQMVSLGFNLIRLGFATTCLMDESTLPSPESISFDTNPELQGRTVTEVMDEVVIQAQKRGIKIILANMRIGPALPPSFEADFGIWFDDNIEEQTWLDMWVRLAKRYAGVRTVVGVDLYNEPHNHPSHPDIVWAGDGMGEPYNWRTAAMRAASAIQKVNPDLLICIQGMASHQTWNGADLRPVLKHPVKLKIPNKLVYSVHDYGPMVNKQPWFNAPGYPLSLPDYWDSIFGFAIAQGIAPVWMGEFGSIFPTTNTSTLLIKETEWLEQIQRYLRARGMSWTWFTWGPNSKDTGGILETDWDTPINPKTEFLKPIFYPAFEAQEGQQPFIPVAHGKFKEYSPNNASWIGSSEYFGNRKLLGKAGSWKEVMYHLKMLYSLIFEPRQY